MKTTAFLLVVLFFISCTQPERDHVTVNSTENTSFDRVTALIHPTEGHEISGIVTFTQAQGGTRVEATVSGLNPESRHGFHIHEYGDCRASDGTSAGSHYNPAGMPHGSPTDTERHVGDLGNLTSDENGVAVLDYLDPEIQLHGQYSILGYGVIVHAQADDLVSQPVGNAGARIGCGVIGVANPEF